METLDLHALEGIDASVGLGYTGDEKTYSGVLRDFHHFIRKYSDAIQSAAESKAQDEFVREVHKLKSSARLIGAMALSQQALRLEMLGREGKWREIKAETPRLLADYRRFELILAPFEERRIAKTGGALPPEELRRELESLKKCVSAFDYDGAMESVTKLEERLLPSKIEELFPKLLDSVESFEFEDAENYVNQMLD